MHWGLHARLRTKAATIILWKKHINLWKIEEDVKKALLFNEIYFGQQNNVEHFFKRGAIELSVWIEHGVKKAYFSTEYILVNTGWTLFKKGIIELSVWIEEDVKKSLLYNRIYFGQQMLNTFKKVL